MNIRSIFTALLVATIFASCSKAQPEPTPPTPSIETMTGQMILRGFRGLELNDEMRVVQDIKAGRIGGVVLFDYDVELKSPVRNIESPQQVKRLNSELQNLSTTPLYIAVDQEGGRVRRLKTKFGFPSTVSAQYLGDLNNTDSTTYQAAKLAETVAEHGFNLNFAPVLDLNSNPDNPVIGKIERSFSANPASVVTHAGTIIAEHRKARVLTAVKHFPGHGSAWNDSHLGMADVTDTWDNSELIPYQQLLGSSNSPDMVMTAHIFNAKLDSTWPATLSESVNTGILRERMGFDGVIVSEDLQMKAVRDFYGLETVIERSLAAGVDILLFGNNLVYEDDIAERTIAIVTKLVKDGKVSRERIEASYKRIMKLKERL